ncbi:nucleotidyltransferase family protein [Lysinibacillus sp. FSL K6-3209]|uniref:nucleotidyltransferase family protein n=1 Tax=Lysinibacillus sp. FSL K6-3209 TaxID=2921497 RepID=UPI0030DA8453
MVYTDWENNLILLLSKESLSYVEVDTLKQLLKMPLNWVRVIGLLKMHHIFPNVSVIIRKYIVDETNFEYGYVKLKTMANLEYKLQQEIANEQLQHQLQLIEILNTAEIPYALLDGLPNSQSSYKNSLHSPYYDSKVLVNYKDKGKVITCLQSIGYMPNEADGNLGTGDRTLEKLKPIDLVKSTDMKFLSIFKIRLQFSPHPLIERNIQEEVTEELLKNVQILTIDGVQFKVLLWEDMLLSLCVDVYKDKKYNKDVSLCKYTDIYRLIKAQNINWDVFIKKGKAHNVEYLAFEVLYEVEELYYPLIPLLALKELSTDKFFEEDVVVNQDHNDWHADLLSKLLK